MTREQLVGTFRRFVAALRDENAQAVAEYSVMMFWFFAMGVATWFGVVPSMLKAYEIYMHGFWLVLGLPVP